LTRSGICATIIKEDRLSTIEKLKKKLYEKPVRNDITIAEVIRIAKAYGCEIITGGNHQVRIIHKPTGTVIPIPTHGKTVKEAYIGELKDLLDEIDNLGGDCDD
jgi:hypothetical protein